MKWITPDFQEVHPDSLNGTSRGQELPGFLSFGPVPSQWILLWVLIALAIGCIFADPFCQGAQAQTDKEAGRCWGRECLFAGWWGFFVLFIGFFFSPLPISEVHHVCVFEFRRGERLSYEFWMLPRRKH